VRPLLALLLLLSGPVAAQRPACGFGLGMQALAEAERRLAAGTVAPSLGSGRDAAGDAARSLTAAAERFDGCRCPTSAAAVWEAAAAGQMAALATDFPMLTARLAGTQARLTDAKRGLGERGCH